MKVRLIWVNRWINTHYVTYAESLLPTYANYAAGMYAASTLMRRWEYLLSISPPSSEIMVMDRSRDEIKGLLESVRDSLSVK